MAKQKPRYKLAKIYDAGGDLSQRWFAYFYLLDKATNQYTRKKEYVSAKLNAQERYAALRVKVEAINSLLINGNLAPKPPEVQPDIVPLEKAIANAVERKRLYISKRGYMTFKSSANLLLRWLKRNHLHRITPAQFTRTMAAQAVDAVARQRKWSARTRNNHLGFWKTIFESLLEQDLLEVNPFARIKNVRQEEAQILIWTDTQKKVLADYCRGHDPELLAVVLLVYHCFIRPAEICRLEAQDFDFESGLIHTRSGSTKNRRNKSVTMSAQVAEVMRPIVARCQPHWFVFASRLKPGPKQIGINTIVSHFNRAKRETGLPKALKMYALKHTGNSELLAKGVSLELLKEQNRHSSVSQTEIYAKRIQRIAIEAFRDMPRI